MHKSAKVCTNRLILCNLFGCVRKKQYLCSRLPLRKGEFEGVRIYIFNNIFMALKIVVLAKQVPDTRNVGKDAMTAEGTVNRAALPAIFNPEDLNALEQALRLKEQNPGSTVGS